MLAANGTILRYTTPNGPAQGTVWARIHHPPRGMPAMCAWVRAADGYALVGRINGVWCWIPDVPESLDIGSTVVATQHQPAETVEQMSLLSPEAG